MSVETTDPARRHRRLMELFDEACELDRGAEAAWLAALSGDDAALRAPLAAMLAQDRRSEVFFDADRPPGAQLLAEDILRSGLSKQGTTAAQEIPAQIGEYRIIGRIGAGAMGTVYEAEQETPLRRVAIKALHPFLVSPRARARFRFEAQALAELAHVGIPRVHTVGEDHGLVYFAMELVRGETLIAHAASAGLDVRARIGLVASIADAVHHAHLRGFVHRDLKPDNVRVATDGRPRVLDFGIAAALREHQSSAELEVAGTLSYMAPEQLDPRARIDGRADVYALGVLLFEILAGHTPRALTGLDFDEALRTVLEEPLPRLGSAVSLPRALGADLEAIVARATARDPKDRYAGAADFAGDLRNALAAQPIEARPRTFLYVASSFARRHRGPAAASAVLLAAIVVSSGVSTALWVRAERLREAEVLQREHAEHARARAEREAARAAATAAFLDDLLTQASPDNAMGREVTVRDALDRAAERLASGGLDGRPETECSVRATLAETFLAIGDVARARSEADQAVVRCTEAQRAGGRPLTRSLLLIAELEFHAGHLDVATSAAERALAAAGTADDGAASDALVANALHMRAILAREAGHLDDSRARFREALEQRRALHAAARVPADDLTATMNQYAYALALGGAYSEAEPLYREALALDERQYGGAHPEVATDLHHIAWLEHQRGHERAALTLLDRAEAIRRATLGDHHPRLGNQQMFRAAVLYDLGELDASREALAEGLAIMRASYPASDPSVVRGAILGSRLAAASGDAAGAERLTSEAMTQLEARYGASHWVTAEMRVAHAEALRSAGRADEARDEARRATRDLERALGPDGRAAREARALRDALL